MNMRRVTLSVLSVGLCTAAGALIAERKYVDVNEIVSKSPQLQECQKRIKDKGQSYEQEFMTKQQKLDAAQKEFMAKKSTMSESAQAQEVAKLRSMEEETKIRATSAKNEFDAFCMQEQAKLEKELVEAAREYAKANNIQEVLDKVTGRPLYIAPELDATSQVAAQMNKKAAPAKPAGPVAPAATQAAKK